jgi:hypothetical protein
MPKLRDEKLKQMESKAKSIKIDGFVIVFRFIRSFISLSLIRIKDALVHFIFIYIKKMLWLMDNLN